jgi:hypothetical protein
MPNAPRFARFALLLTGSAILAGLAATWATPRYAGARVPPAATLPWPPDALPSDRQLPFALLYVDSHCAHCSRAAVLVDSLAVANDLRVVFASRDTPSDADAYRSHLGLHRSLMVDSSAALIHALGTGSVPTLVVFHADGTRHLLVGFTRDGPYRAALSELER